MHESLILTIVVLAGVTFFIIKGRKEYFDTLSQLPLNSSNSESVISNSKAYDEASK